MVLGCFFIFVCKLSIFATAKKNECSRKKQKTTQQNKNTGGCRYHAQPRLSRLNASTARSSGASAIRYQISVQRSGIRLDARQYRAVGSSECGVPRGAHTERYARGCGASSVYLRLGVSVYLHDCLVVCLSVLPSFSRSCVLLVLYLVCFCLCVVVLSYLRLYLGVGLHWAIFLSAVSACARMVSDTFSLPGNSFTLVRASYCVKRVSLFFSRRSSSKTAAVPHLVAAVLHF